MIIKKLSLLLEQVHKPGVAAALARLEAEGLPNVKIAQGDAITALADHIEDGSLSSCCIFFPDPFPQDRDTERREVLSARAVRCSSPTSSLSIPCAALVESRVHGESVLSP